MFDSDFYSTFRSISCLSIKEVFFNIFKGSWDCATKIARNHGVRAFYNGAFTNVIFFKYISKKNLNFLKALKIALKWFLFILFFANVFLLGIFVSFQISDPILSRYFAVLAVPWCWPSTRRSASTPTKPWAFTIFLRQINGSFGPIYYNLLFCSFFDHFDTHGSHCFSPLITYYTLKSLVLFSLFQIL